MPKVTSSTNTAPTPHAKRRRPASAVCQTGQRPIRSHLTQTIAPMHKSTNANAANADALRPDHCCWNIGERAFDRDTLPIGIHSRQVNPSQPAACIAANAHANQKPTPACPQSPGGLQGNICPLRPVQIQRCRFIVFPPMAEDEFGWLTTVMSTTLQPRRCTCGVDAS